jgi:hypothetical protein
MLALILSLLFNQIVPTYLADSETQLVYTWDENRNTYVWSGEINLEDTLVWNDPDTLIVWCTENNDWLILTTEDGIIMEIDLSKFRDENDSE